MQLAWRPGCWGVEASLRSLLPLSITYDEPSKTWGGGDSEDVNLGGRVKKHLDQTKTLHILQEPALWTLLCRWRTSPPGFMCVEVGPSSLVSVTISCRCAAVWHDATESRTVHSCICLLTYYFHLSVWYCVDSLSSVSQLHVEILRKWPRQRRAEQSLSGSVSKPQRLDQMFMFWRQQADREQWASWEKLSSHFSWSWIQIKFREIRLKHGSWGTHSFMFGIKAWQLIKRLLKLQYG